MRILLPTLSMLSLLAWPATGFGLADGPVRTLRVLAWPGYADAEVVKSFEQRHAVHVDLTLVATDEALWERINGNQGGDFDVFAVNTAELQRYIDRRLVQPIDAAAIPNTQRQLPRFRKVEAIAGLTRGGKVYGVPYTYAEMGLIYDRSQFAQPPDSIAALWDPRLRGRILAYDGGGHSFSLAAMILGKASPFRMAEADWPQAVARLIALRRNVLGFYAQPDEAARLFRKHRVALLFANYGTQQVKALKAAGADIGYVIPKEGALAWLDCWVVTQGTKDLALAYAWIDHLLGEQASGLLVARQGLANTIAEPSGSGAADRLLWLEPMENPGRRDKLWARIMSGDSAARVLGP
ncbi:MAG: extracellular solute-binding protein [Rhodocyclales bacterium]|nr:extracellular solute-binding protein [Rhodocyclales bacterium]